MEKFINDLTSAQWWAGVVLVGILINLISSYLKPAMDALFSRVSGVWKQKTDKRNSKQKELENTLKSNSLKQVIFLQNEQRFRWYAATFMLLGILFLGIAEFIEMPRYMKSISYFVSAFSFFYSVQQHFAAEKMMKVIKRLHEDIPHE